MKNVFYITTAVILIGSCSMSDGVTNMNNGYLHARESNYSQVIEDESGKVIVPCTVIDFDYDKDFIVAAQVENKDCFSLVSDKATPLYWIIDCKSNKVYSYLSLEQYLDFKEKFRISERLKLKVEHK
jgi:hypothetical protein